MITRSMTFSSKDFSVGVVVPEGTVTSVLETTVVVVVTVTEL